MHTTTFKFTVEGDSYIELSEKADATIARFLGTDFEEEEWEFEEDIPKHSVNYEMIVLPSEKSYKAEVIARIKNV